MKSLRQYLVSVAMFLALLVCAAAAALLYQTDRFGRAQAERQLLDTTRALSLAVDGELKRYEATLFALSKSDSIARDDWRAFDAQARALIGDRNAWIVVGDRSGRQFVNTRLPLGTPLPQGGPAPAIWSGLEYGRSRICDLVRGRLEPNLICVDVPYLRNGRVLYHVSAMLRPEQLRSVIGPQRVAAGTYNSVLDRRGIVIWRNVEPEKYVGTPGTRNLVEAMRTRSEGVLESKSLNGVPTLAAFSRSPMSGWTFVVGVPRSTIGAGTARALAYGSLTALALLLLAGAFGIYAARRISGAVGTLSDAAGRIRSGHAPGFRASGILEIDEVGVALEDAIEARALSDERFALAQDIGGIGSFDWDVPNDEGHVSESYKSMHGLSAHSGPLKLAQVLAVVHPDDLSAYQHRLELARRSDGASTSEYRVVHPDTSVRWISAKGRALHDDRGRYARAVGIVRDVTAEREADRALRESQERLAIATEAAEVGVWDLDPASGALLLMPRARSILGLDPRASYTTEAMLARVHPDDRERIAGRLRDAMDPALRDTRPFEFRVQHSSGELRWVRAHGRATFEGKAGSERAVRYTGANLDITDRVRAEENLVRLSEVLQERVEERTAERDRLWALSPDPFVISDDRGIWLAASPAWTALLGWPEEELVGRTSEWMEHPDDRAATKDLRQRLSEGGDVTEFVNRFRTRDGSYRWLQWTAVAEPGRIYSIARDVTAERERAEALRKAEDALRQSQKMESIGQITGGLAHDFNNLLSPILGTLDLLQKRGLPDPRAERLVGGALEAAERARILVQRLLAFARRQPLQPGAVDVAVLVHGLRSLLESTIGPQIALRIEAEHDVPAALADPNQLELALLNLAVNARDAMPDGGQFEVRISHETFTAESGGAAGNVVISVTDTGAGMPQSILERAIEPFFSTKGSGRGTGLGLSMVHGLVAQLGGTMDIDSEVGRGTVIRLSLPVAPLRAAEPADPGTNERGVDPDAAPEGLALLVDDEALVRSNIAAMLADLGYAVIEAASADEARQILDHRSGVDILITDHLMPITTGTELARSVADIFPDMPILIVSGYSDVADIAPDLPRLAKPFRQSELARAVAVARQRKAPGNA
ncbi:PAS domain-containing protein [Allosphingosinicella deserti]|uniref:histidine kinase n=1 Tax=Allosphingosinicella deserti TaxID=2116704 RepID=A0A2P7QLT6_9SPHN|nr:PAS domain-containing protein [Sphingomonas deserti]PSJ38938.1 hypothetical protein C7I55_16620 [Sphingomonas deserti]